MGTRPQVASLRGIKETERQGPKAGAWGWQRALERGTQRPCPPVLGWRPAVQASPRATKAGEGRNGDRPVLCGKSGPCPTVDQPSQSNPSSRVQPGEPLLARTRRCCLAPLTCAGEPTDTCLPPHTDPEHSRPSLRPGSLRPRTGAQAAGSSSTMGAGAALGGGGGGQRWSGHLHEAPGPDVRAAPRQCGLPSHPPRFRGLAAPGRLQARTLGPRRLLFTRGRRPGRGWGHRRAPGLPSPRAGAARDPCASSGRRHVMGRPARRPLPSSLAASPSGWASATGRPREEDAADRARRRLCGRGEAELGAPPGSAPPPGEAKAAVGGAPRRSSPAIRPPAPRGPGRFRRGSNTETQAGRGGDPRIRGQAMRALRAEDEEPGRPPDPGPGPSAGCSYLVRARAAVRAAKSEAGARRSGRLKRGGAGGRGRCRLSGSL